MIKFEGVLTTQSARIIRKEAVIADVRVSRKLVCSMNTKYDLFEDRRRIPYLMEFFKIQTKNILNAHKYVEDYLMSVPEDEFETCEANEWFLACDLLEGFSPGELEINKSRFQTIQDQFESFAPLTLE